ncbi:MAG TPA: hemolysin family protein [Gemmatimonadales bacterium]|nr:hemolysin family protein [Gemmatimonadales bacterium]
MIEAFLPFLAQTAAVAAAVWAGVLALVEQAPTIARTVEEDLTRQPGTLPLYRALHVSRLALMIVAGVAAARAVGWWYLQPVVGWGSAAATVAFLYVVADALPRMVGVLVPELAAAAAPLGLKSLRAFRPLLSLVSAAERLVTSLLPRARPHEVLGPAQRDILLGVFALGDTSVADIMTPRLDIVAVDVGMTWSEMVDRVRRAGHARLPVCQGTLDNVIGALHARDLVPAATGVAPVPPRWQDLVRPVQFVPETKTLDAQLRDFRRAPGDLAIVVDEFGGTSGLVTREDVLEEVVGEIHDEYDTDEEPAVERDADGRFLVDGRLTLEALSAALGAPVEHPDVSTVGGLVYSELGHVPAVGEALTVGEYRVVVEQVHRRRIRRVSFERQAGDTARAATEPAGEGAP